MTNEQAIAILRRIQEPEAWDPRISKEGFEAIEMAVNALKGDPIDRDKLTHDLIRILHDDVCAPNGHLDPYYVFKTIKDQPDVATNLQSTCNQLATDCIWEALSKVYNMADVPDEAKSIIGDVMLGLDEPSVQPEPCNGCGYLGESCVGEGCGKLTERKDGETG